MSRFSTQIDFHRIAILSQVIFCQSNLTFILDLNGVCTCKSTLLNKKEQYLSQVFCVDYVYCSKTATLDLRLTCSHIFFKNIDLHFLSKCLAKKTEALKIWVCPLFPSANWQVIAILVSQPYTPPSS